MRAFFKDGHQLGLNIEYSVEDQPLGTAGPLSLVADRLGDTFIVSNGDVLTTLNLRELLRAHHDSGAAATIAAHRRQVRIDLGVLQLNDQDELTGYLEKPTYDYFVSMGIYVFEPRVLQHIPPNQYLDFPDLVLKLVAAGEVVRSYCYEGYWQDLGRPDDYEQAVKDFDLLRDRILTAGSA
jgi:NDP-sugar pyrophosphorylase family protein